jgi:hypothetical protein
MTNCKQISIAASWSLCFGTLVIALVGCGSSERSPQVAFTIEVTIDQHPVENVRVAIAVKESPNDAIVLEGITDHTGTAAMVLKDGVELVSAPTEYAVLCESLGDWQVSKPWSDITKTPLTVTWPSSEPVTIELPAKAARSL